MSGLTVPRAGTTAGRSAAVQVEASQMGEIVSQAANVALSIGTQLENDRLSRQAQRTQVDMTADFNNLRLEAESIGDPDQLDQFWQNGTGVLRKKWSDGVGEDGQRLVDPKNAERVGLAFDELSNRHAFAVGAKSLEARQSQREATWLRYQHEAGNMAASTPDAQTRAVLLARGDEMIAGLLASGTITAEDAELRRLSLRNGMANETAIRQVASDPAEFLRAAATGRYADLGAETVARYSVQAQNAIDVAAAAAAREEEAALRARNTEIGNRLGDFRDIFSKDRTPVDQVFMSLPEVQAHPEYVKTLAALELSIERADLPFYTPDQLRAAIAQEQARPVDAPYQTERLEVLEDQLAVATESWSQDPVSYAASIGMPVQSLPDFDPSNPQDFVAALGARQTLAQQLVEEGYIAQPRALSEDDRDTIRGLAAVSQNPEDRVALAQAIIPSLRGVGADNTNEFIDDPVFLHVGHQLAQNTISRGVATEIFRGQQVIGEGNVVMPPIAERTQASFETIKDLFAELPGGERLQSSIMASADALYAARVRKSDPASDIDEDVYRQSLHEVMGGSGVFDGRRAMGGVQDVNDSPVVLPRGVNAGDVEDVFDTLDMMHRDDLPPSLREMAQSPRGVRTATFGGHVALSRLEAASLTGAAPIYEGEDLMALLDNARLQAVGNDRYVVLYPTNAGPTVLYDKNGAEFQFSLRSLLAEVGQ